MNNKKKVIFIYEGVKAEEKLLNNMNKIFFSSKTPLYKFLRKKYRTGLSVV